MSDLRTDTLDTSEVNAKKLLSEQIESLLVQLPGWVVKQVESVDRIEKVFSFKDFRDALAFTNKVGALAEQANHHPALLTEWGQVTVTWWSHDLGGLHRNDMIMAARTDQLS